MSEYTTPSTIVLGVLGEIGSRFPDETAKNVNELIEHNEVGAALDVLCTQIYEYGIKLSDRNKSELIDAAGLMHIPLSDLDGLSC